MQVTGKLTIATEMTVPPEVADGAVVAAGARSLGARWDFSVLWGHWSWVTTG